MLKWIITLVFTSFVVIINAPNPIVLINSEISTIDETLEVLAEIQTYEALPFVLFVTSITQTYHRLQLPEDLRETLTVKKKMIKGTKFLATGSETQVFLCPKQNSLEKCLTIQEFDFTEQLRCSEEPTPVVFSNRPTPNSCSFKGDSTAYTIGYDICPNEGMYNYPQLEFDFYRFCYHNPKQKTLYTTHYIQSPKLLKSRLLYREQNLSYPYSNLDNFPIENFDEIFNSLSSEVMAFIEKSKPMYRVQKLVPSENMALGTWKKTAFLFVNLQFQHKMLFLFWNEMNARVRNEAIRLYDYGIRFFIATGVFDINTDMSEIDGQILNMWVTVITSISTNTMKGTHAVVFMMNNFIEFYTEDPYILLLQTEILDYCSNDSCDDNFNIRTEGRVMCCKATEKIAGLFGPDIIETKLPLLQIRGLTKIVT